MQAFIFSVTRAACPVNLSLFHSIVLLAFAEEWGQGYEAPLYADRLQPPATFPS